MKIKDIKLMKISVITDEQKIYEGDVEKAPEEIQMLETKSIHFDSGEMIINV